MPNPLKMLDKMQDRSISVIAATTQFGNRHSKVDKNREIYSLIGSGIWVMILRTTHSSSEFGKLVSKFTTGWPRTYPWLFVKDIRRNP